MKKNSVKTTAIWAGEGSLPYHTAVNALSRGRRVIVVLLPGLSDRGILRGSGAELHEIPLGRVGAHFRLLEKEGVDELVMIGKFHKKALFRGGFDASGLRLVAGLSDTRDMTIFRLLESELSLRGIRVASQAKYLSSFLADEGLMTRRKPDAREWKDIRCGFRVARRLADLDIGQTVIVRKGTVVALEALEGTDETIRRVSPAIGRFSAVVKAARRRQDPRFDIPGIGLRTLENMRTAGLRVIAVQAGQCLIADKPELIRLADRRGVSLIGLSRDGR